MALAIDVLELVPARHARGRVAVPGSKSVSNRVLLLAALAQGRTEITGLLESDDTHVMRDALGRLGVRVEQDGERVVVEGCDGYFPIGRAALFVGNSGLSIRTLVPAIAVALSERGEGSVELSGVPRMHERPIADLVEGLAQWGARIVWLGRPGYPPLRIEATALRANDVRVRGDTSSQFLTGLLQAAPLLAATHVLAIDVDGELISRPYVDLTLGLMQRFGVAVGVEGAQRFVVAPGQRYRSPGRLEVEGDASSASYFLAAGAIGGGPVRVARVGRSSAQGDVRFADALAQMGAAITWGDDWIEAAGPGPLRGIDLDCNHIPDAAMTLAVCALHADGPTTLRGIGSWRVKETDRIAAMATELRKFGVRIDEGADWLRIEPLEQLRPAEVDTYDDHRMAMALSLASLGARAVAVRVRDPGCVAKTFPHFFEAFAHVVVRPAAAP